MFRKILPVVSLCILFYIQASGQACTTLGQNPSTAFPVCGSSAFHQDVVPNCGDKAIPVPGCEGTALYSDLNPFWYKFTCFQSGTLGFNITPVDLNDDYDWQLFDVTGKNPDDVYTDKSMFVAGNWSGYTGITGASASGSPTVSCAGDYPIFSQMPKIIQGHHYLLLLSHFTTFKPGDAGYSLSFGGGTASIVDTLHPAMLSASAICEGKTIDVRINKNVKCASLALDGSDFMISPNVANVISASGYNCSNSFDMDSIRITLDKTPPPGLYSLVIKNGKDKNTLLDNCDAAIDSNSSVPFTITQLLPTPMDSITPVQCAPNILQLVFKKPMLCSTVEPGGSDFTVTGPTTVAIAKAFGDNCNNGLSNIIKLQLAQPIQTGGIYTITLKTGRDGNTIYDECSLQTPVGSTISFVAADTVNADFYYNLQLGCAFDTLYYAHDGRNGITNWNWTFDANGTSTARDSLFQFNDYGSKHISLNVTNGICSDSASTNILLDNELLSRFNVTPKGLCPEDAATFTDTSIGKIVSWYWIFGDGTYSYVQNPSPKYYAQPTKEVGDTYPATLIIKNDIGCYDTAQQFMQVYYNCYIAVPTGFTPNGDGLNDYLYPLNAYKADNLEFRVYNRWGQLVFETKDWTKKWDGTINGNKQAAGTYIWMLHYVNHDTGVPISLKGTTVLIR